ncbi:aldehyde dehydrogenase family protein, partial [Salmonella enterica subsp. enterica]
QLSGGMRKRAAMARLMASDPETLLMDEPFGALDAQMRLTLQTELLRLCRKLNKTVLFVTHDVDEAIALVNANPFGNGTGLFTQSGAAARKFQSEIDVGQVGINIPI